jgi:DNA invertase Pin-like site-specific DNA recombinase
VRFENVGIHFCSLAEGINTTTPGGKLVYHLFAAFAEFQRDIIRENTALGLEAAKQRGVVLGRPRLLSTDIIIAGHRAVIVEGLSVSSVARLYNVSPATITRSFQRAGMDFIH